MRLTLTIIILLISSFHLSAQSSPAYVPGELFIQFRESSGGYEALTSDRLPPEVTEITGFLSEDQWSRAFRLRTPELQGIIHLTLPDTTDLHRLIEKLEAHPDVNYAEKVPDYQLFYTPNDLAPQQWGLDKVQAEDAWDLATGNSSVVVAIVDDAVQITHPDLAANIWTNPGEIPGNNLDDDGNGYVDDVNGYDVAMNDNDVNPPGIVPGSLFDHGTHTAGIASAVTDNGTGIASIGFNVSILPVKIGEDQFGQLKNAYQGVEYAILTGADVINMSWGGPSQSQTYQLLFDQAYQQGIVCVASAGNDDGPIPMYPGSYDHVINVGWTDQQDKKGPLSNYGATVDVMAPGSSIWSTVPDYVGYYDYMSGTSMACPLVAGLAGLIKSARPGFTVDEIVNCILTTADDIDAQNPGYIGQLGSGRINAYEAIKCALACGFSVTADRGQVCPGDTVHYFGTFDSLVTHFEWSFPGGIPSTSTDTNPVVVYPNAGVYDYAIEIGCPVDTQTYTYQGAITVATPTASLAGSYSVIYGSTVLITANLTGLPPYTVTYTDGIDTFTQSGITNSPFLLPYTAVRNDTVYLVSITDNNCDGTVSGMAEINIISNDSCAGGVKGRIFQNTYKDFANLNTHSVEIDDSGFIYTTGLYSLPGNMDLYLSKLDTSGREIWTSTFGNPSVNETGYPVSAFSSSTGAVYVGGGSGSAILSKFDPSGNLLWTTGPTSSGNDFVRTILELPSGNILGLGTDNSRGPRPSDPFIMNITPTGNTNWYKIIGGATNNDHVNEAKFTGPNELTWVGVTQSFGPPPRSGMILKTDTNGNILWEKCYSTGSEYRFYNFISDSTGIVVTGYHFNTPTGDYMLVHKVDQSGNVIWARHYTYNGQTNGIDIGRSPLGGYYVSGTLVDSIGSKVYLAHLDDVGNVIWAKKYGGALPSIANRFGHNIVVSETGIILAGTAGNGSYVIQTDFCGNSGCAEEDIQFQESILNPTVHNTALTTINLTPNGPINLASTSRTLLHDTLCTAFVIPDTCYLSGDFGFDAACAGDSTLIYSTTDTSYHAINYWDLGDGTVITGVDSLKHVYELPGTYTIKMIAFSFQEACSDTVEKQITILSDFSATGGDTVMVCLEDSTKMIGPPLLNCGIPPFSYTWSPGMGLSDSTVSNPGIVPIDNRTYTLIVTDSLGHSDTVHYYVEVDSHCCYHSVELSAKDTVVCLGDTMEFYLAGPGLLTAQWDFGSVATPGSYNGLTPPPVLFNTPGYHPVRVYYMDTCGPDTLTLHVGIVRLPELPDVHDTIGCVGDTIQLGGPPIAYYEYEWAPPLNLDLPLRSNPNVVVTVPTTYTLTYTDRQTGCSNEMTVEVDTMGKIPPPLLQDTSVCPGTTVELSTLKALPVYRWSTGDSTTTITVSAPGTYWVETENQCGTSQDTMQLSHYPPPTVDAGQDTSIAFGQEVQLQGTATDSFYWSPNVSISCLDCLDPIVNPDDTITYYLTMVDTNGCTNIDSVNVYIIRICENIALPNAFTPNGDGLNDQFTPILVGGSEELILFQVFNRWGELLHETGDPANGWDGTYKDEAQPLGSYTYVLRYRCSEGEEPEVAYGSVTLIR